MAESSYDETCPICGKEYASVNGMKNHHMKTHGESLAERVTVSCAWCGEEKDVVPAKAEASENHFCDHECTSKWQSENLSGENSPLRDRITVECDWCGEPKEIVPRDAENDHHFCDRECRGKWCSENWTGEDHPKWSRVTVDCEWCGSDVEVKTHVVEHGRHVFCGTGSPSEDNECFRKWASERNSGEDHRDWKGGDVPKNCAWCGEDLHVRRANAERYDRHFCPPDSESEGASCQGKWLSKHRSGEDSALWKDRVEVKCTYCGEPKMVRQWKAENQERHFCLSTDGSRHGPCFRNWKSENRVGENTSRWNGGHDGNYGPNWKRQRSAALSRDNGTCRHPQCDMAREEHRIKYGRDIEVHHIVRKESFRLDDGSLDHESANQLSNLITLCKEHHAKYEGVPLDTRHFPVPTEGDAQAD